jgi:HTH-type transcriptional regulator / antitoxin HigA
MGECKKMLRSLAAFPEGVSQVPNALAKFGIRFVVVEHLYGTKIDGAALWLGKGLSKPVIVVSARYDRIDSFWHTLCHEVSHIEHQDFGAIIDIDLLGEEKQNEDQDVINKENRANEDAANMLIEKEKIESFIKRKRPYFSKKSIIQFANAQKIHPGIVAGQLHYRIGNYKSNREMLVKIRDILISRALTDGWGIQISKGNKYGKDQN